MTRTGMPAFVRGQLFFMVDDDGSRGLQPVNWHEQLWTSGHAPTMAPLHIRHCLAVLKSLSSSACVWTVHECLLIEDIAVGLILYQDSLA